MRTLACLAALFALCAHAEVFKWVDAQGQTQYGEVPPPGAAATRMNVPPPAANTDAPKAAEKPKDPASKAPSAEDRAARCDFERTQLVVLEADAPIVYKDAKGQMVDLDPAKRAATKQQVLDNVKKYCS
jgi:Domain of unknown function (DUF4124)